MRVLSDGASERRQAGPEDARRPVRPTSELWARGRKRLDNTTKQESGRLRTHLGGRPAVVGVGGRVEVHRGVRRRVVRQRRPAAERRRAQRCREAGRRERRGERGGLGADLGSGRAALSGIAEKAEIVISAIPVYSGWAAVQRNSAAEP